MSGKKAEPKSKRKKVEFLLYAPQATEVVLLGDFNGWKGTKHRMKKGAQGTWERVLMLLPGAYEYKYLVDGTWWENTPGFHKKINSYGTYNSLLKVTE